MDLSLLYFTLFCSWWHNLIIRTFLKVFMFFWSLIFIFPEHQHIKSTEYGHGTSKMGKCNDDYIPTCKLDNNNYITITITITQLPRTSPPPTLHGSIGQEVAWRYSSELCGSSTSYSSSLEPSTQWGVPWFRSSEGPPHVSMHRGQTSKWIEGEGELY